jgi:hypothetical protein
VESYDPHANLWTILPPKKFTRHRHAGAKVNGKLQQASGDAASGGAPGTELHTDVHEVLDIEGK